MPPMLSVVVPLFEVEPYVCACLKSLVEQQLDDVEIIVVDDGSTDAGPEIAKKLAREDTRLRVVDQPHAGLSAARNTGIRLARGRYLAFCDSDDVVPAGGYTALVSSLEMTGSDLASGDVRRFDSTGARAYRGYRDLFAESRQRTHIRRCPALVRDRMVWNKVFRRDFWMAQALEFTLPVYEDAPVMMRAHIEAATVDVLSDVVYHWRARERGVPSITQRRNEPGNLTASLRMVLDTFDVIENRAPELIPHYVDDMCRGDVRKVLRWLHVHDAAAMSEALTLARRFALRVPDTELNALPVADRQLMELVIAGDFDRVRDLVETPPHATA